MFSNIDNQKLGKFLQIAYIDGIRNQLSEDFRDFEQVKMMREGDPNGRQVNFLLKTSYGPSAVQYRNPNFTSDFPKSQRISSSEFSAVYKEIDSTVEIEYNLWKRAQKSPAKYAEPLAEELSSKVIVAKRRMAADLYGDGTGVVCEAASIVESLGAGEVTVTVSTADTAAGFIGFAEEGDVLLAYAQDATFRDPTTTGSGGTNTFYGYLVLEKDREAGTVKLQLVDSSYNVITTETATNIVATDVFYRVGQPTIPDRTSVTDYGTETEVIPGLESLGSADGRTVHGMTMSGTTRGTVKDNGAAALDTDAIEAALNAAKIRVGESAYAYKKMCMAPETHSKFIISRENDRRFNTLQDNAKGLKVFGYQHRNDFLEAYASEYCPKTRVWMLPESRQNQGKVLECWTTDFEPVQANDSGQFHLKPSPNGGHQRFITTYMEATGTMLTRHPAAIASIRNFV